jgi:hypothetical protein
MVEVTQRYKYFDMQFCARKYKKYFLNSFLIFYRSGIISEKNYFFQGMILLYYMILSNCYMTQTKNISVLR